MDVLEETYDVGVIIGRFQVPKLHEAHLELFKHVMSKHNKVIVFIGLSAIPGTKNNPLDYESRKQMILEEFPQVTVGYIKDVNSDLVWAKRLDGMISDLLTPSQTAVLYGSRDSFIEHYPGKYPCRELIQKVWISGTEIRKNIASNSVKASPEFREGAIWQTTNRYPTVFHTVDIVLFNHDGTEVLLGRKPNETQHRFIGGFTDINSPSDEADAVREVEEETGIKLDILDLEYSHSENIDDWRYRSESDIIRTVVFCATIPVDQVAKAADDIAAVKYFNIVDLDIDRDIVPEHRSIARKVLKD